jgi:hypothetical protein
MLPDKTDSDVVSHAVTASEESLLSHLIYVVPGRLMCRPVEVPSLQKVRNTRRG